MGQDERVRIWSDSTGFYCSYRIPGDNTTWHYPAGCVSLTLPEILKHLAARFEEVG